MLLLWAALIAAVALTAAEPSAADQTAMQDVLRRYLFAVNTCDAEGARAAVTTEFRAQGSWPRGLSEKLLPKPEHCKDPKFAFEITALARVVVLVTSDAAFTDAYFRTIGLPTGEQAGRLYVVFARREKDWKIFSLRFHALPSERPVLTVEPAKEHDQPGPDGWISLFDGSATDKFTDASGDPFPGSWRVDEGALRAVAMKNGRALRTKDTYRSFDLEFEWKATPKGNSGIKYRLFFIWVGIGGPTGGSDGAGFEYQLVDDDGDPGAMKHPTERAGALYNQIAPKGAVPKPLGEYNQGRIVVKGRHCEHWLNGVKVVEFDVESSPQESPILIQHHGTDMSLRNIRIRRLD
jgi:hypothetical protein